MIDFVAQLGGKIVTYPMAATFVIERREGRRRYRQIAFKPDIHSALSKFHRSEAPGCTVRMRSIYRGAYKTLVTLET